MASKEISEFLTSRRATVTPEQAGLPAYGTNRRVSGLRREEVALLAGISVEYYTRLERGAATGISEAVLDGVASALQLDDAERVHLQNLFRAAQAPTNPRRRPSRTTVRPGLQRVLDSMSGATAYVRNGRSDVLAANAFGRALYGPIFDMGDAVPNVARYVFLGPTAADFFTDFGRVGAEAVAILRAEAGRDPYDRQLTALVGELSTRSDRFRQLWARHDVSLHRTGSKRLHHPVVIAPGGAGVVIASQSGHWLPALTPAEDRALATTPTEELLTLPMLEPDRVTDPLHAYQLAKRGNAFRVTAEAVRWGRRGARVNTISPGIIITPLARDELTGPRGDGYRRMIEACPAGRAGTPDEVGTVGELLMSAAGAFITGSDILMDGGVTASYKYGPAQPRTASPPEWVGIRA